MTKKSGYNKKIISKIRTTSQMKASSPPSNMEEGRPQLLKYPLGCCLGIKLRSGVMILAICSIIKNIAAVAHLASIWTDDWDFDKLYDGYVPDGEGEDRLTPLVFFYLFGILLILFDAAMTARLFFGALLKSHELITHWIRYSVAVLIFAVIHFIAAIISMALEDTEETGGKWRMWGVHVTIGRKVFLVDAFLIGFYFYGLLLTLNLSHEWGRRVLAGIRSRQGGVSPQRPSVVDSDASGSQRKSFNPVDYI